jgi:hypothetical protein
MAVPAVSHAQAFLDFPLQGETPYTIGIISVMDHSGTPLDSVTPGAWYSKDGKVTAYTGETGQIGYGANCAPPGYKNSNGTNFVVNGNYIGATCYPGETDNSSYLNYDGHSGYDYQAASQTTIYAPADGILKKAAIDNVNHNSAICGSVNGWDEWHSFYIDHGNGYVSWYLHANSLEPNIESQIGNDYSKTVVIHKGDPVALSGRFGAGTSGICGNPLGMPAHLHFEVRKTPVERPTGYDQVIDPYSSPSLWNASNPSCTSINNVSDLQNITNLAGSYCLTQDIDASTVANFAPIGSSTAPFTGTFDGQGHSIKNLTINQTDPLVSSAVVGLFAYVQTTGNIRNLGLTNVSVSATSQQTLAGALVGYNFGSITNSYVTGSITAGGCCNGSFVGGLVGLHMAGTIANSYSSAAVQNTSIGHVNNGTSTGGLAGESDGTITRSYATGSVTGSTDGLWVENTGGLVGTAGGSIQQSYATGPVTGGYATGGLVGAEFGSITQSYARGSANGGPGSATLFVSGYLPGTGGLVGFDGRGTISEAYATGLTAAGLNSPTGGLIGVTSNSPTNSNTYWDFQTTGQPTSAGGIGETTAQLTTGLPNGFESTVWGSNPSINNGYPNLLPQGAVVPTTALASSPNPSTVGQSVIFTATVSVNAGTPTGTVTFYDGATAIGTGPLSSGTATFSTASLSIGSHSITAVYGGDSNFATSKSSVLTQTVNASSVSLSVSIAGNGTVTSSPSGVNCTSTCSPSFPAGTAVTLTATAGSGSYFSGWTGACSGTGSCVVTMNSAQSVSATFVSGPSYSLSVFISGNGTVTSTPSGISCTPTCGASFAINPPVTLNAAPASGWTFSGWTGACSGTSGCSVTMNAAQSVAATFTSTGGTQAFRTWVSALTGSDSNPCSRAAPCLTFAAALANTAAGGEIDALDYGDYGPVTITKAITLDGGNVAYIGASGSNAITILAGATDVVIIRKLLIDGFRGNGVQ